MNQLFKPEALERLKIIFPQDGEARFERLEKFVKIASQSQFPLVVPASIDVDLHEVLSARCDDGSGLELCKIGGHTAAPHLGNTLGRSLAELSHIDCLRTVAVLRNEGFEIDNIPYSTPACVLRVLAN